MKEEYNIHLIIETPEERKPSAIERIVEAVQSATWGIFSLCVLGLLGVFAWFFILALL